MRICLVSEEFPVETPKGGIATYQYQISKDLIQLGHEVHVICKTLENEDREEIFEGINLHYLSGKSELTLEEDFTYRNKVKSKMVELEERVDIFEIADWGAEGFYYLPIRNKPTVIKLHTPHYVWNSYNHLPMDERMERLEQDEIESLKLADSIYSCSNSLANIVKETLPELENIEVIYNPLPQIKQNIKRNEQKKLLFVGSLEERKVVLQLASVLNNFLEKNLDFKVVFAGKDTDRNRFHTSTKKVVLSKVNVKFHSRVIFKGHCSKDELEKLFLSSSVCIFPSLFENFPYVMLEAISMQCPVIGSINGGMAEIIEHGKSGWLCDPFSKVELLEVLQEAVDSNEKSKIAKNAIQRVIDLKLNKAAEATAEYYEKVIKHYEKKTIYHRH